MSEIWFFTELGDRLEQAAAAQLHQPRRPRWRASGVRVRIAALAVLLLSGGVAAAAVLNDGNSTARLVATGVVCHSGTDQQNSHDVIFTSATTLHGHATSGSPTSICAAQLADAGDHGRAAGSLVACASHRYGIEVYVRDGRADQCSRLGLRPVPAGYHAAVNRVAALDSALSKLSTSADCIAPAKFDRSVKSILHRQGFAGWHLYHHHAQFSGQCGQFPSAMLGFNGPLAVHGSNQTVVVTTGPSRSTYRTTNMVRASLGEATSGRCVSVRELERRARAQILAQPSHPGKITFGVFHNARENHLDPQTQRLYNHGCAIFLLVLPGQSSNPSPTPDTLPPGFRVTILQRDAPHELPGFKFEEQG